MDDCIIDTASGEVWAAVLVRVKKAWDGMKEGGAVRVVHHPQAGVGPDETAEAIGRLVALLGGSVVAERDGARPGEVVYVIRKA